MANEIRRRERQVPADGQLGLGFGAPSPSAEQPTGSRGKAQFKRGNKRLFVGSMPLEEYLHEAGLGWLVHMMAILNELDFSSFIAQYEGTGRHPYHPRMIMALILYGTLERKGTLRELESLAARDVGAWWICEGLRPDHSTIGRFFCRHQDLITETFFVDLARSIVERLHLKAGDAVIDGTVIEAASSHMRAMKAEALKRAADEAQQTAAANPDDAAALRKADELGEAVKVCAERDAQREAKNRHRGGAQVVPHEPEAVVQKQKNGAMRPSYKPSVMVHESGLAVGVHVEPTSETAAVEPLIEQHRAVFYAAPQCAMLDAGYFTALVLSFFVEQDIDVLCPSGRAFNDESMERRRRSEGTRFLKNEFVYDEQNDTYVCPSRRLLVLEHESRDANGPYRRYRGTSCSDCPLKAQCTTSPARTLKRYECDDIKDAMTEVMRQPQAKARFRRRSCGERPFAGIKARQGFTRFRRRGLRGARLETVLQFAAWNIQLAARALVRGALVVAHVTLWRAGRSADGTMFVTADSILLVWMIR